MPSPSAVTKRSPAAPGTVGRKLFALDSNGLLDQSAIRPKLICVIENLRDAGAAAGEMLPQPFIVRVRTDLNLRSGPGPAFAIVASLVDGTRLDVLSFTSNASGRWALVDLQGDGIKDGFVFATFIEPA